jgi:hypothetical protein
VRFGWPLSSAGEVRRTSWQGCYAWRHKRQPFELQCWRSLVTYPPMTG